MRVLITTEYDGTNFSGWQKQVNKRTIQSEIEAALYSIFKEKIKVWGSGRTDSGVHAIAQTAHFDISDTSIKNFTIFNKLDSIKLVKALNATLPIDIKILKARRVSNSFHAQFNVKKKTYIYRLETNVVRPSPLNARFVGTCLKSLDIEKMREASSYLIGEHDFTSFCNSRTSVIDFRRTIYDITIKKHKNLFCFEISGDGFLYNMIRIIIGTLADVGTCKIEPKEIKSILRSKSRSAAGKTVSASGLYLKKVIY